MQPEKSHPSSASGLPDISVVLPKVLWLLLLVMRWWVLCTSSMKPSLSLQSLTPGWIIIQKAKAFPPPTFFPCEGTNKKTPTCWFQPFVYLFSPKPLMGINSQLWSIGMQVGLPVVFSLTWEYNGNPTSGNTSEITSEGNTSEITSGNTSGIEFSPNLFGGCWVFGPTPPTAKPRSRQDMRSNILCANVDWSHKSRWRKAGVGGGVETLEFYRVKDIIFLDGVGFRSCFFAGFGGEFGVGRWWSQFLGDEGGLVQYFWGMSGLLQLDTCCIRYEKPFLIVVFLARCLPPTGLATISPLMLQIQSAVNNKASQQTMSRG